MIRAIRSFLWHRFSLPRMDAVTADLRRKRDKLSASHRSTKRVDQALVFHKTQMLRKGLA